MIKGRKVYDPLTDTWSTGYWIVDGKGNYYPVWQKGAGMERLTSNKPADSMPIIELAHNSCYVDENNTARYRDYNLDIDCRELARNLINDMCDEDLSYMSDENFDEYMAEMLSVEIESPQ